jgi:hypothetical protein
VRRNSGSNFDDEETGFVEKDKSAIKVSLSRFSVEALSSRIAWD